MGEQKPKLSQSGVWLGITPTLWWNDDFINIDIGIPFEQCVSEMALAGYSGCSIGHKFPIEPDKLRNALELRGLRISEPWVSTYFTIEEREQTIRNVRERLDFLNAVEGSSGDPKRAKRADLVVAELGHAVHPLPIALYRNCPTFSPRQWELLIEGLHEIGRITKEEGRLLCYHPHLGTGVMKPQAVDYLFNNTDSAFVNMLLDTAHLAAGDLLDRLEQQPGKIASELLPLTRKFLQTVTRKFAARIKHIHLKDIRAVIVERTHREGLSFEQAIESGIFTVPGDGSIEVLPEILGLLAEANFTGWLVIEAEQDPAKANPLKYATMAQAFLKQHLEE